MDALEQWPTEPEEIKLYLCDLWLRKYPDQGCLPFYYSWVRKRVHISRIICGKPGYRLSEEKVNGYIAQLLSGKSLAPLVCLYGELLDGYHRYGAYRDAGVFLDNIDIYLNKN